MLVNSLNKITEKQYPIFYKTCLYLQKTFFYKDIFANNDKIPVNYPLAEKICSDALAMCKNNWDKYNEKLNELLELGIDFLKLQAQLQKTGKYLYSPAKEVKSLEVNQTWGLYFTEIFWATHHRLFNFFLKEFAGKTPPALQGICLDIPVGSGIFLSNFLSANKGWAGTGVDISGAAIDFAKRLFGVNGQLNQVKLIKEDINRYSTRSGINFDRIICVEFLEHVKNPIAILKKLKDLLTDDGKVFLATVAWAANIDHIYLYKSAQEIRNHIAQSGFKIEREYVQNIFLKDAGKLEQSNVAINYSAILMK